VSEAPHARMRTITRLCIYTHAYAHAHAHAQRLLGWYSFRANTPLRPSLREARSLSRARARALFCKRALDDRHVFLPSLYPLPSSPFMHRWNNSPSSEEEFVVRGAGGGWKRQTWTHPAWGGGGREMGKERRRQRARERVQCFLPCSALGIGFRVQSFGFRVSGFGFRV